MLAISVALIAVGIGYELSLPERADMQSEKMIEHRIRVLLASTDMVSQGWLDVSVTSQQFTAMAWKTETPDEWRRNGVSFYLTEKDKIIFWANHKFTDRSADSLIIHGSNKIEQVADSKVLILTRELGDYRAVTIIELMNKGVANPAIFDSPTIDISNTLPQNNSGTKIQRLGFLSANAYMVVKCDDQINAFSTTMGWFAIFLALGALTIYLILHTATQNSIRTIIGYGIFMFLVRIATNYFNILHPRDESWNSINSVAVSYLMLLIYLWYIFAIRNRLSRDIQRLSPVARWTTFVVSTIALCSALLIFHCSIINIIDHSPIISQVYRIFSFSFFEIKFYLVCAIFATCIIIYGLASRFVFAKLNPVWRIVITIVVVVAMIAPMGSLAEATFLILIGFLFLFILTLTLYSTPQTSKIFLVEVIVVSLYLTSIVAWRALVVKEQTSVQYAIALSHNQLNSKIQYEQMTCSTISPWGVTFHQGPSIDLGELIALTENTPRGSMRGKDFVHVIEPCPDGQLAVVSYPAITWFDLCSLVSYIFLGLYLVSGLMLYFLGADPFNLRANRNLAHRIEVVVVGVVVFSMTVVALVVYQYSESNYRSRERELLNNTSTRLMESFGRYCRDNVKVTANELLATADSVCINWYTDRGNAFNAKVTLYNLAGEKIASNEPKISPSKINHLAYARLSHYAMPYYDQYRNQQAAIYMALLINRVKVGYFELKIHRTENTYERFWLLNNIYNIFAILLIVSLILSIVLYTLVAGPIKTLTESLSEIGKLQKIPIIQHAKMNDEVGRLIVQYNHMIDYLEASYAALAKSEREGAWREMARQVAHEINNPLTPMRLKIQMLQRARKEHSPLMESQLDSTLEVLVEQIDVLSEIAGEFSDLARLEQGAMSKLEISPVIKNIVTLYANNTKELNISYVDQSKTELWVMTSYIPFSRLLVNVLQNATQALNGSGSIVVTLGQDEKKAVIDIWDNGSGIDPELLERIFEPNFTTRTNGSGLGLAMCRQIVISFGGTISVQSSLGVGSTFTITLPTV
ncbi:MAG: ATP-binding protein [Mucinivorans sp.]